MQTQQAVVSGVTVNGVPLRVWLDREKSTEVQRFLADELRSMRRISRKPIVTVKRGW